MFVEDLVRESVAAPQERQNAERVAALLEHRNAEGAATRLVRALISQGLLRTVQ